MTSRAPSSSPRRHRGRRAGLTALLAGAIVAGGLAFSATAGPASAVTTDPTLYTNVVTLQTGSTNVVTTYGADAGVSTATQTLSSKSNNCTLTSKNDAVITFGPDPAVAGKVVGLRAGSIGIVDKLSGESCAQATPGETLELTLPATMSEAVLDVEVQKNAVITATLTSGSGSSAVTATRTLRSGEAAVGRPASDNFFSCLPGATSSAPNSNDNCRWVITGALFDKIALVATQGQFSLEGGADGPIPLNPIATNPQEPEGAAWPTTRTYFKSAACDATNTLTQIASTGSGGDLLPTGYVKRSFINLDGTVCLDDDLTARAFDANTVDIIKTGQAYGQYVTALNWRKSPTTDAIRSDAISETTIEFDLPSPPGGRSDAATLPWCPSELYNDATSVLEPVTGGRVLKALPEGITADGLTAEELRQYNIYDMDDLDTNSVQFACILDRDVSYVPATTTPVAPAMYVVSDVIYVLGDLRMRG